MKVYPRVHDPLVECGHKIFGAGLKHTSSSRAGRGKLLTGIFITHVPLQCCRQRLKTEMYPGQMHTRSLNVALGAEGGRWLRNEEQNEFWVLHLCHTQGCPRAVLWSSLGCWQEFLRKVRQGVWWKKKGRVESVCVCVCVYKTECSSKHMSSTILVTCPNTNKVMQYFLLQYFLVIVFLPNSRDYNVTTTTRNW